MTIRGMMIAGALAAVLVVPAAAEAAWSGFAAKTVNLRMGPGPGHAKIAVVPAGARLTVFTCFNWCQVRFAGMTGWMSAKYVASRPGYGSGQIIVGPGPAYPSPNLYPHHPRPHPWHNPWHRQSGVNIWFGF